MSLIKASIRCPLCGGEVRQWKLDGYTGQQVVTNQYVCLDCEVSGQEPLWTRLEELEYELEMTKEINSLPLYAADCGWRGGIIVRAEDQEQAIQIMKKYESEHGYIDERDFKEFICPIALPKEPALVYMYWGDA